MHSFSGAITRKFPDSSGNDQGGGGEGVEKHACNSVIIYPISPRYYYNKRAPMYPNLADRFVYQSPFANLPCRGFLKRLAGVTCCCSTYNNEKKTPRCPVSCGGRRRLRCLGTRIWSSVRPVASCVCFRIPNGDLY